MLTDFYLPVIGGRQKHIQSLGRELVKRGHEVVVCTIGHPSLPRYEEKNGVKLYRVEGFFQKIPFLYKDPMIKMPPPTQDWLLSEKLRQVIEKVKPDILHIHSWIIYSTLQLKNTFHLPLVTTLHSYELICPKATLLRGFDICDEPLTNECLLCGRREYGIVKSFFAYLGTRLNKNKLKAVDKFIAVSYFVREVHAKYLSLEDKDIEVIPNFCAPEPADPTTVATNFPEDFILFVGVLIPVKGLSILIEAYQRLNTKTKLVLIGAKHPGYHYENTGNVLVIVNAPQEVVTDAYKRCRFAVFASIWPEPFATVTLEAMSHKKAVIASRTGGFADAVMDGETGILVPPNDPNALANAMDYLLENPQVAEKMGQEGYKRWRQNFTPEVVVPKIERLYQSLF